MELSDPELEADLNGQTGKLGWQELQRHYGRGVVMCVAIELDLIGVALHFIKDDKGAVSKLMDKGQLVAANDDDARNWQRSGTELWAVVVAPWVLVQNTR